MLRIPYRPLPTSCADPDNEEEEEEDIGYCSEG
jgi:hypothetical protein